MHNNLIIGVAVLAAFVLSITLALYGARMLDRERQWRPRRYGLSAREVPCSFCGKAVRAEAIICRYCHHRLDEVIEAKASDDEIVADDALNPAETVSAKGHAAASAAAMAMPANVIAEEDLSKNKTFVWLDTAFEQITVREALTEWGPASARASVQSSDGGVHASPAATVGAVPMVRTIGPLSTTPPLSQTRDWRGWFTEQWFATRKREWGIAAAVALIAVVVGGSTFLAGPSKPRVDAKDDYVTFDVSERAPLAAVPDLKPGANTVRASKAEAPVPAKPETPPVPRSAAVPTMAMIAPPEFPLPLQSQPVSAPANNAGTIAPQASVAPVPARPPEDWASSVSRAIKPALSKDLVVAVQRLIRAEGFDPGIIDGMVGPRTRGAILAYQRNGGLPPTGEIDHDLLVKLQLAGRTVRVIGPMSGVATVEQKGKAK